MLFYPSSMSITIGSQVKTIFIYQGFDRAIAKKTRLKFVQYLGTGTSKRHQIWHECV